VRNDQFHPGDRISGFTVVSAKAVPEYRSHGIRLIHEKTRADVYHLINQDTENLFSFNFRTPPSNSTGVPHILEHAVLAGSTRFPVKDPFVALLKGSMQTFLNAMTFPDKTVYPASSQVEKDLFNLMLVYGDAVFSPLLREEIFKQEGHHLEPTRGDEPESDLNIVGVVYNEMKGNYSSPESIAGEWSIRSLFPDTPYGFDSGGDPEHIPELTYEQFVSFHHQYYHPSNCRIFLYGNISTQTYLSFLEEHFLEQFSCRAIDSEIPYQPRWLESRRVERTYPVKENDRLAKKSTVTVNWLSAPVIDPFTTTAMKILAEVLVGHAGSPLYKALMDSKLGEDIAPATGLETELKELVFTIGLRGTDPDKVASCEEVIFTTLGELRDKGIPDDIVQAALQRVEFSSREITGGGRAPFGLRLMRKALQGWLHDVDPEITLEFNRWMAMCKEKLATDRSFFPTLIDQQLLGNPHRSTVLLRPDPEHWKRVEARSAVWLKEKAREFSGKGWQSLVAAVEDLKRFQETPDPPEETKKIPFLELQDLPRAVERIPYEVSHLDRDIPLYLHDVFTNGIVYIDLVFDSSVLDEDMSRMLPLLGGALCGSGLPGIHYSEVARMLALVTGGFTANGYASGTIGNIFHTKEHVYFRLKVLREHLTSGLALVKRLLVEADFTDYQRLKDLILELKNSFRASVIPNGHNFVSIRAGSRLSGALSVEERWKGIEQMLHLTTASAALDETIEKISTALQTMRSSLLSQSNLVIGVTAEADSFEAAMQELSQLIAFLPPGEKRPVGTTGPKPYQLQSGSVEAFRAPTNVGYVAKAVRGAAAGTAESAHEAVLSHLLRTGYLWEKVRMRGGAYGAFAVPHGTEGVFIFSSYRDPNILETLTAFRDSLCYAAEGTIDRDQIEKAIIGTVGKDEKPLEPGEKGFINLKRKLIGATDEIRQFRRDTILSVNGDDLAKAADNLLREFDAGAVVVLSGPQALARAGQAMAALGEKVVDLPL